jgi:general secretion pathway protein G
MRLPYLKICLTILVALVIGTLAIGGRAEIQREKYSRAKIDISDLQTGLEHFHADNGRYPSTEEGLGTLFDPAEMDSGFVRGMARPQSPLDPWGHHYFYQSDGENFVLGSYGPHEGDHPDSSLIIRSN